MQIIAFQIGKYVLLSPEGLHLASRDFTVFVLFVYGTPLSRYLSIPLWSLSRK